MKSLWVKKMWPTGSSVRLKALGQSIHTGPPAVSTR